MQKLKSLVQPQFLLWFLLGFHLCGNLLWLYLNNMPPLWDEAGHTRDAVIYYNIFSDVLSGKIDWFYLQEVLHNFYPPLVKVIAGALMLFLYPDIKMAQFVGTLFFLGTLVMTYKLAGYIFNSKYTAFLSAFIFSFYLNVYCRSRSLSLDIALIFFYLSGIYFYLRSNSLEKRRESIIFTIFLICSLLTKIQALIYWLPVALFSLINIFYAHKDSNLFKKRTINSFLVIIISTIFVLPWLFYNWPTLQTYLRLSSITEIDEPSSVYQINYWLYYLKIYISDLATIPGAILSLLGLFYFFKKFQYRSFFLIIIGTIYLLFSFFPHKDDRFIYPILPFIAIVSASFVGVFTKKYAIPFILLFVLYQITLYSTISFGFPWQMQFDIIKRRYNPIKYNYQQAVKVYKDLVYQTDEPLVFLPNYAGFNVNIFTIYTQLQRLTKASFIQSGGRTSFSSIQEVENYLKPYQYFFYTDSDIGVSWLIDLRALQQMQKYIKNRILHKQAEILYSFTAPEGQKIQLVKIIHD